MIQEFHKIYVSASARIVNNFVDVSDVSLTIPGIAVVAVAKRTSRVRPILFNNQSLGGQNDNTFLLVLFIKEERQSNDMLTMIMMIQQCDKKLVWHGIIKQGASFVLQISFE